MPPAFNSFTCPNCQALYQVVRVEAGPETNNREITCSVCDAPLLGRKGKFVLKYFLLRKAIRSRRGAQLLRSFRSVRERAERFPFAHQHQKMWNGTACSVWDRASALTLRSVVLYHPCG